MWCDRIVGSCAPLVSSGRSRSAQCEWEVKFCLYGMFDADCVHGRGLRRARLPHGCFDVKKVLPACVLEVPFALAGFV